MHVAKLVSRQGGREYVSHLVRQSYREDGKVKHRTLANLSPLPQVAIDAVRRVLQGDVDVFAAPSKILIERSLPHGNVSAVVGTLKKVGLEQMLGRERTRERDVCVAMIAARLLAPNSKLATSRWWESSTLADTLGIAGTGEDEMYAAMDWLLAQQSRIEKKLADKHLHAGSLVLYDLTSSYMEGTHCPLAMRGYSRDGKKGTLQIEYGLVTDDEGRPVAVEVFKGSMGDPSTVATQVTKIKDRFGLRDVVLVGDRGMLTSARIEKLKEVGGLEWISSLRAPQIRAMVDSGTLQLSLFDERNLAEISDPAFPGERLVVCKNPALAEERARKREDLLCATEEKLAPIVAAVAAGRLSGTAEIGVKVGAVRNKHKVGKHFELVITDDRLVVTRKQAEITAEAALDGLYVIRTSVDEKTMSSDAVVRGYKSLAHVERAWRCFKAVDLHVRPIHHRLEDRVRAHILLCMLAYYVQWHMERAWAPLLFRDEDRPFQVDPVAPAQRSVAATRKARTQRKPDGAAVHSFRTLLAELATLTRNRVTLHGAGEAGPIEITATPTPLQHQALSLLGLASAL
jgi:transposase